MFSMGFRCVVSHPKISVRACRSAPHLPAQMQGFPLSTVVPRPWQPRCKTVSRDLRLVVALDGATRDLDLEPGPIGLASRKVTSASRPDAPAIRPAFGKKK